MVFNCHATKGWVPRRNGLIPQGKSTPSHRQARVPSRHGKHQGSIPGGQQQGLPGVHKHSARVDVATQTVHTHAHSQWSTASLAFRGLGNQPCPLKTAW